MPEKVQAQQVQTPQDQTASQKSGKKTIFFVAIPIVLLQIVIAYLLVLDLNSKTNPPSDDGKIKTQAVDKKIGDEYKINESEYVISHPEFLFVVKDLIVNPAGTGGLRYLLTSVGIEVTNEKAFAEIQSKEVIVNDILINVLSSKTLEELSDVTKRKDLRREIAKKVDEILTQGRVQNVYFSKFIIQ
ncbi:flagellar FliL protein [Candidatus Thermokryptus mobilis]|uniref:Flagellar protein FliL n=1 Tax=Candidatus Thermokryptus mobilis TaxID=1643428 RepID=A0A0S4N5V7_9BACT|nr:flagellar basal body-associated FliL family protein [Candidatus Thermokryptus mobilis]CUU06634.1 flagellar FliL protein [Candidatus Thermokryptus mobilis]